MWHKPAKGVTLIELLIVVVLLAILSATALPRFSGKAGVEEITIQDRLISLLRLSQTRAMQNTSAHTSFTLPHADLPGADSTVQIQLFDQKTSGGNSIGGLQFNAFGQPLIDDGSGTFIQAAGGLRFEIQGMETKTVCIESEGYIHPC